MTPIVATLVLCLRAQPDICTDPRVLTPDDPPTSLMGCLVTGQQQAAQWMEQHPQFRRDYVVTVRCGAGERRT